MAGIKVKYIGLSHVRGLSKSDLARAKVDDQGAVSFDVTNNWVVELSEKAAEFLLSSDPEFREAVEDDELIRDVARPEVLNLEAGEAAPVLPLGENYVVHTTEGPRHLRSVEGGKRRGVKARQSPAAPITSVGVAGQSSVASSTGTTSSGGSGTSGSSGSGSSG